MISAAPRSTLFTSVHTKCGFQPEILNSTIDPDGETSRENSPCVGHGSIMYFKVFWYEFNDGSWFKMAATKHSYNVQRFAQFEKNRTYLARSADYNHVLSKQQEVHTLMGELNGLMFLSNTKNFGQLCAHFSRNHRCTTHFARDISFCQISEMARRDCSCSWRYLWSQHYLPASTYDPVRKA